MDTCELPVEFTEQAIEEILRIIQRKGIPENYYLRVGLRGGGCGVTKVIGFDVKKPEDMSWMVEGIEVVMDKRHLMHLIGTRVTFIEDEERRGFLFE